MQKDSNNLIQTIKYFLFGLALCFCPFTLLAQQNKIDSLSLCLKKNIHDTDRVKTLNALGWELKNSNPDTAIILSNQALVIARKRSDRSNLTDKEIASLTLAMTKAEVNTLGNLGVYYRLKADYPKALGYYLKALKLDEELHNKEGIAKRLGNIGLVYWNQSDYPKALDYYFKALKMAEELGNKNGIAADLGNIGIVYHEQADYPKALDYYFKALKMKEELGNKNGIAITLGNIGSVYKEQADYPKALDYYFKALKMHEELGDKNHIAGCLGNIGSVYTKTSGNLPTQKLRQAGFAEAEKYLLEALKIDKEIGAQDVERQVEELLSDLYIKTNRFQLALEHYKKAMVLKDTLFSEEKNKEITRKEMNYEFEKKEAAAKAEADKQAAVAEAEKKKQQVILYSVIGGLLVVLIFALFIFRALRITQKQKQLIEQQKKIVEEKQNEILASIRYAKRIQDAILPTEKYIAKTLSRLNPPRS